MTEQPAEVPPLEEVHITFGERNNDNPRDVPITVGGWEPVVLIVFRECTQGPGKMDIHVDSTGFDRTETADLFRRLAYAIESEEGKVDVNEGETTHEAIARSNEESEANK